jgi:hypothetical protein
MLSFTLRHHIYAPRISLRSLRPASLSAVPPSARFRSTTAPRLQTLLPPALTPEAFVSPAGTTVFRVYAGGVYSVLVYAPAEPGTTTYERPWPAHARGYLYLHVPRPTQLAGAEIRLRVPTNQLAPQVARKKGPPPPSPEEVFAHGGGTDLLGPDGVPWLVPASTLLRTSSRYSHLRPLLADAFPEPVLNYWASLDRALPRTFDTVLHSLGQRFVLDLTAPRRVWIVDGVRLHKAVLDGYNLDSARNRVYEGALLDAKVSILC